jgi:enterochelin esterase-like enzyme
MWPRAGRALTTAVVCAGTALAAFGWFHMHRASVPSAIEALVADIEAGHRSTPVLGARLPDGRVPVTFFARSIDGRAPRIVSDITGWGEHIDGTFDFTVGRMSRVGRTPWFSLGTAVDDGARIEYLVSYAPNTYQPDTHNPRHAPGEAFGGAPASEFVTPGYQVPAEFAGEAPPLAGSTSTHTLHSRHLATACEVVVYTPPGYPSRKDYPVTVLLDLRAGPITRVLDWRITHGLLPPQVVVLVGPESGGTPFFSVPLQQFLGDELLPWLLSRYTIAREAERRAVVALSFGAKDALAAGLSCGGTHTRPFLFPDWAEDAGAQPSGTADCTTRVFGRVGLLIPGRRIRREDVASIPPVGRLPLRVAILAGRYDHANAPTARTVREALAAGGYEVGYIEVPEGHSATTWIHHLGALLTELWRPAEPSRS